MDGSELHEKTDRLLVIGYGNTLRSDDGVGCRVAEAIAGLNFPKIRCISCHQLTPELAGCMAESRGVIFVDAAVDGAPDVQLTRVAPAETGRLLAHAADPGALLALARDVFGRCPEAWCLAIPVENTDLGEELSPFACGGMKEAVEKITELYWSGALVAAL